MVVIVRMIKNATVKIKYHHIEVVIRILLMSVIVQNNIDVCFTSELKFKFRVK